MSYIVYDSLYVVNTLLTILVKFYLIRVLYRMIKQRRWPKWN